MYNRYVPQPDGSFRRNSMADHHSQPSKSDPKPPPKQEPLCEPTPICHPPKPEHPQSIGSFLKSLLPKGFDTADLLIVLLLILMAGDCEEDQNTALLTLVLYLFL